MAKDWSQVRRLMIDETSTRKGHRYVTVVLDAESHDRLLMVEGRSAQAVTEFLAAAMPAHGAKAQAITEVVMDMSPAYIAGVQAHFSSARIVFDLFHIMNLARGALDAVRKSLRKQGADLTGGLWGARKSNSSCAASWLAPTRRWAAHRFARRPRRVADGDLPSLRWWLGWADRRRARTLPQTLSNSQRTLPRFHGILAYLESRLTNAAIEAVNSLLQMAKRIARGFRNFHYFRLAAYLKASRLNLQLPHPFLLETSKRLIFETYQSGQTLQ